MEIREDVRKRLIETAKKGEGNTITYGKLMHEFHIPRGNPNPEKGIGDIVGKISEAEHEHKPRKPLLSALVVHKGDKSIGNGFYVMARYVKRLKSRKKQDEEKFWHKEQKNVWKHWHQ